MGFGIRVNELYKGLKGNARTSGPCSDYQAKNHRFGFR